MSEFIDEWKNFLCAILWPRFITSAVLAVGLYVGATSAPQGKVQLLLYALAVFAGSLAGGEFHKRYANEGSPMEIRDEYSSKVIAVLRKRNKKKLMYNDDLLQLIEESLKNNRA